MKESQQGHLVTGRLCLGEPVNPPRFRLWWQVGQCLHEFPGGRNALAIEPTDELDILGVDFFPAKLGLAGIELFQLLQLIAQLKRQPF